MTPESASAAGLVARRLVGAFCRRLLGSECGGGYR